MANPEHLKILEHGVEAWNRWRRENPNVRPDLSNVDLGAADLGFTNLSGADLHRTKLYRANFHRTNLDAADLRSADLRGALLEAAHLRGADLSAAYLRGANLGAADLRGADRPGDSPETMVARPRETCGSSSGIDPAWVRLACRSGVL